MDLSLVVESGVYAGRALQVLGPRYVIGRDPDCNLRPASESVSRYHCEILVQGGRVTVRDLGSMNGTVVNGRRLEDQAATLRDGDRLEVGPLAFTVRIEAPAGVAGTAQSPGGRTTPPPDNLGAAEEVKAGRRPPPVGARTAPLRPTRPSVSDPTPLPKQTGAPGPATAPVAARQAPAGPARTVPGVPPAPPVLDRTTLPATHDVVPTGTTLHAVPALPPASETRPVPPAPAPAAARTEGETVVESAADTLPPDTPLGTEEIRALDEPVEPAAPADAPPADETEAVAKALTEDAKPLTAPTPNRLKPAGDYEGISKAANDILMKMRPKKRK